MWPPWKVPTPVVLLGALALGGCGGEDPPADGPCVAMDPTERGVTCILEESCAFSGCHGGGDGTAQARLDFQPVLDGEQTLREVLVGVSACEYDRMDLVAPGDPDSSWLVIKLDGPHDELGTLDFAPAPDWTPGLSSVDDPCPLRSSDGTVSFGAIMPLPRSIGPVTPLPDAEIELVRTWIADGAPGAE